MIGFVEGFLAWTASTWIPAFVGVLVIVEAGHRLRPKYLAAFALGIFLWFFVDTIQGSALFDVNAGFSGGAGQVAAAVFFLVWVLLFFLVDPGAGFFSYATVFWGVTVTLKP